MPAPGNPPNPPPTGRPSARASTPREVDELRQFRAELTGQAPSRPVFPYLKPPQSHDELGRLGNYRVLRILGQGGMGTVFVAQDFNLHRMVALKVMKPDVAQDPTAMQRFLREARATAALKSDYVVSIHQVNQEDGVPYVAMDLLDGESLESRLQRDGRLSPVDVWRVARDGARGLAAAHAKGLIHRDIKPDNLFLESFERSGPLPAAVNRLTFRRVKLLDFGLARMLAESGLTQTGMIVGTPQYMSPEQARGHELDGRSDLFSLGVVLYRAATGELPFKGEDLLAQMAALTNREAIPPSVINPEIPPSLSSLIMRLLAKSPAARPKAAAEVIDALELLTRPARIEPNIGELTSPSTALPSAETFIPDLVWEAPDPFTRSADGTTVLNPTVPRSASEPTEQMSKPALPRPAWPMWPLYVGSAVVGAVVMLAMSSLMPLGSRPSTPPANSGKDDTSNGSPASTSNPSEKNALSKNANASVAIAKRFGEPIPPDQRGRRHPTATHFSADAPRFAIGGADGGIRVYDSATGGLIRDWKAHGGRVGALVSFQKGDAWASAGSDDQALYVWRGQAEKGEPVELPPLFQPLRLAATEDGRWLLVHGRAGVTTANEHRLLVVELPGGKPNADLVVGAVCALSGDGFSAAASSVKDAAISYWRLEDGKPTPRPLPTEPSKTKAPIHALAMNEDGSRIIVAREDGSWGDIELTTNSWRGPRRLAPPKSVILGFIGARMAIFHNPDARTILAIDLEQASAPAAADWTTVPLATETNGKGPAPTLAPNGGGVAVVAEDGVVHVEDLPPSAAAAGR